MKILRWLLCHLLLITVLVSLSLGFVFRESLKEDFNHLTGKSNQSVKLETVAGEKTNKRQSSDESKSSTASLNDPEKESQTVNNVQKSVKLEQHSVSRTDAGKLASTPTNRVGLNAPSQDGRIISDPWAQVIPSNSEINKSSEPAERKLSSADEGSNFPPDNYIPEENGSESNPFASKGNSEQITLLSSGVSAHDQAPTRLKGRPDVPATGNSSVESSDYPAALADVRQLYWDGKTGAAQAAYERLMFDYPGQPEAAAELGNIFLQQGNRKAASWAYQNAIPRYLNLHREQEAINLMRFISQYDPAIAESLQKKYW